MNNEEQIHLEKAKESACLAVEIYNKPLIKFRSCGYIVLMNIAWTSLFHAIFFRRGVEPFYKDEVGQYLKIEDDYKAWELSKCLQEYYRGDNPPVRTNLDFFIGLRNKIEHRSMPELDLKIFGECQAMLFNFETKMIQEFGEENGLSGNLALALQFSHSSLKEQTQAIQRLHKPLVEDVQTYIDSFRSSLGGDILASLEYSYKVFLIPKVGNCNARDTVAIEFIQYDPDNPEKMSQYEHLVAMIKPKTVEVVNVDGLTAGGVCRKITPKLKEMYGSNIKFTASSHHVRAWKYYKIRPDNGTKEPEKTNAKFCRYDKTHKDYVYTEAWTVFLLNEFADIAKYKKVVGYKT
jgi:hypothetical protein